MQRLQVVGNLTKDVEVKTVNSKGKEYLMTTLSVAVNDDDNTLFIDFDVWGKQAENAGKFLQKGSKVFIEGTMQNNVYEKDGVKHYGYKFRADNVTYLSNTKAVSSEMANLVSNRPKNVATESNVKQDENTLSK